MSSASFSLPSLVPPVSISPLCQISVAHLHFQGWNTTIYQFLFQYINQPLGKYLCSAKETNFSAVKSASIISLLPLSYCSSQLGEFSDPPTITFPLLLQLLFLPMNLLDPAVKTLLLYCLWEGKKPVQNLWRAGHRCLKIPAQDANDHCSFLLQPVNPHPSSPVWLLGFRNRTYVFPACAQQIIQQSSSKTRILVLW